MSLNNIVSYAATCILLVSTALAQQSNIKKGTRYYNNYSYSKAIEKLERVSQKTTDVNRKLADSYMHLGNVEKAEKYYAAVASAADATASDAYNYFTALRSSGKYDESEAWIEKFHDNVSTDSRGQEYKNNTGGFAKLLSDEGRFTIKNLAMNTSDQDFGVSYFGKQIVYSSSKSVVKATSRTWNGNKKNFLNLYVADRGANNELNNAKLLNSSFNKKYHEGTVSYNAAGDFMVFTRNNYENKSSDGVTKLQLFSSELKDNKWTKPVSFTFNNKEYSTGHPSLTSDGKTMYFVSDMPGGKGGSDIYRSTKGSDGVWSMPENLGGNINTEGNELFPSIHKDGLLFFASNGHVGLGGLDIFVAQIKKDKAGKLQNVGVPVNGPRDDFGFILDEDQKSGYFSSNRLEGKGDDDIYSLECLKPFKFGKQINGVAKDKSGEILDEAKIYLYDSKGQLLDSATTASDGSYLFNIENDDVYKLVLLKDDYLVKNATADTKNKDLVEVNFLVDKDPGMAIAGTIFDKATKAPLKDVNVTIKNRETGEVETIVTPVTGDFLRGINKKVGDKISYSIKVESKGYLTETFNYTKILTTPGKQNLNEELDFSLDKLEVGGDLAKMIDIKPIYFDVNKFNIRPDAAAELDKVIAVMTEYPNLYIELGSHTDCRAPIKYNESLSDKRAKASAAYVKAKITNPDRIYGKGYGESKLKNGCACEGTVKSTCSEAEHQENRRTEFIIIKM